MPGRGAGRRLCWCPQAIIFCVGATYGAGGHWSLPPLLQNCYPLFANHPARSNVAWRPPGPYLASVDTGNLVDFKPLYILSTTSTFYKIVPWWNLMWVFNIFRGQSECSEAEHGGDGQRRPRRAESQEEVLHQGDEQTNQIVSHIFILVITNNCF